MRRVDPTWLTGSENAGKNSEKPRKEARWAKVAIYVNPFCKQKYPGSMIVTLQYRPLNAIKPSKLLHKSFFINNHEL